MGKARNALHEAVGKHFVKHKQVGRTIKDAPISFGDYIHHISGLAAWSYMKQEVLVSVLESHRVGLKKFLYVKKKRQCVLALFL